MNCPDATELQRMKTSACPTLFRIALLLAVAFASSSLLHAQENYFVTYSHELDEPGNLKIEAKSVTGGPRAGNPFVATALEFEYGINAWWPSDFYFDGQTTAGESTVFTGFRLEIASALCCANTGSTPSCVSNSKTSLR